MAEAPEFYDLVPATPRNPRTGEGAMAPLQDGRLFFAYTHFVGSDDFDHASIVSRYSSDVGRTWTEPQTLIANEAKDNVMSASLLRLQCGAILLFYMRKDSRTRGAMWVRRSDDEAQTWSDAVCCTLAPLYQGAVNDCAVQLNNGRVILPYEGCEESWVADEHIVAAAAYSDDEGATWRQSNTIFSPKRGAMEPRVVELRDGRLRMLMRTDRGVIDEAYSHDNGETWSDPASTGIESPQSPFVLKRIPSTGDLLLIRNPIAKLDQGHQGYRTPLRSAISQDDGKTWINQKDIEADTNHAYSYVSTTFTEETAVLSYYVDAPGGPLESLRIARVPVAWLCQ